MIQEQEIISLRQAMLLSLTVTYTPSVRIVSGFAAKNAKQAGWLCPIFGVLFIIVLAYILQKIYENNEKASYLDILNIVFGKFLGKVMTFFYIAWIVLLLALNVRYYAERLNSSVYPQAQTKVIILVMLVLVAFIIRSGILIIARMNEVIFITLNIFFILLIILLIPGLKMNYLTPISYQDIIPVAKGSLGIMAIWGYILPIFIIGNKIKDKNMIMKMGLKTSLFLFCVATLLISSTIGTLGYSIIERSPLTFYAAVKQIQVLEIFERIESLLILTWIISDFVIIAVFTYILLQMIKSLFDLKNVKPLLNVLTVFTYFSSLYISRSVFELQEYSEKAGIQINILFAFIIPMIVLSVGKIRKKI